MKTPFGKENQSHDAVPNVVAEELELHLQVKLAVRDAALAQRPDTDDVSRRLVELRDEAAVAAPHDLPALFDQLHLHHSLASREFAANLPDLRSPYFAHMRLNENGKIKHILIGHKTFIDTKRGITIVDWKHAPIAKIFFNYREGDPYEEKLPGKIAEGVVEVRRVLAFDKGLLQRIQSPDSAFFLTDEGHWTEDAGGGVPELGGGERTATRGSSVLGTGATTRPALDVSALLDPQQYALLQADEEDPLLILGGAGCGKTTVALHRLAALHFKNRKKFRPQRMLVIVPDMGLVRLCRKLLSSLELPQVKVTSFDDWIAAQGRHLLRSVPSKCYSSTPAKIVRFKRHAALLEVLPDLEEIRRRGFAEQIRKELSFAPQLAEEFYRLEAPHLLGRIQTAKKLALQWVEKSSNESQAKERTKQVESVFSSLKKQLYNLDIDRQELYTNEALLNKVTSMADGAFSSQMVPELIKYSKIQFAPPPESEYGDIEKDHLVTVDGKMLQDSESNIEILEGTIDVEDYAILFAILKHYTGELRTSHGYYQQFTHMVIDEAQELAPAELHRLGDALSGDASVTIAGDAVQQTDPTATFTSWEHVLAQLGQGQVAAAHLTTNYRSPYPITAFAHHVLGPLAPQQMPKSERQGTPVMRSQTGDEGHAAMQLREALDDLSMREPRASVAIICCDDDSADRVFEWVKMLPKVRRIKKGEFEFEPGIDVTDVAQIKGLEFDYVILPDATIDNYPDLPEARRTLHVAATRAMHQLWVMAVGKESPLLPTLQPKTSK